DVQGDEVALVVALARSHGQDFTLFRLFTSGVGNDDAAGGLEFGFAALDDQAVMQWTDGHGCSYVVVLPSSVGLGRQTEVRRDSRVALGELLLDRFRVLQRRHD